MGFAGTYAGYGPAVYNSISKYYWAGGYKRKRRYRRRRRSRGRYWLAGRSSRARRPMRGSIARSAIPASGTLMTLAGIGANWVYSRMKRERDWEDFRRLPPAPHGFGLGD
jgi:hypothetical protein